MEDFKFKKLSFEELKKIQELESLRTQLGMPVFRIQSPQWQEAWYALSNDINNAIELIHAGSKLPEGFSFEDFSKRAAKFLAQTKIAFPNKPRPEDWYPPEEESR